MDEGRWIYGEEKCQGMPVSSWEGRGREGRGGKGVEEGGEPANAAHGLTLDKGRWIYGEETYQGMPLREWERRGGEEREGEGKAEGRMNQQMQPID